MTFFLQSLMQGISLGALYALAAIGFVLIYRTSLVLNFAQGGFVAMGAFIFIAFSSWGRLPFVLSFVLTPVVAFAIGLGFAKSFHGSLNTVRPMHGAILTIGLALILKSLFSVFPEMPYPAYSAEFFQGLSFVWGGVSLSASSVAAFLVSLFFFVVFGLFFKVSSLGIYLRSATENRSAARALGVPLNTVLALSWAICAMFCAVTGMFIGMNQHASMQELGIIGWKVFPVAVLGGLNNIWGTILGGILIGVLEVLTKGYVSPSFGEIVPYAALFLIIAWKPGGFFPAAETKRSW